MAKDPAFLFYSSDFLTGCFEMSMTERGQYITLLCLQHQKGHLSKKVLSSVGNVSDCVLEKFQVDENGLYFNARLDNEIAVRAARAEANRQNGEKGGRPKGSKNRNKGEEEPKENPSVFCGLSETEPKENPPENENVTIDINSNIDSFNLHSNNILNNNTTTTTTDISNTRAQENPPSLLEVMVYFQTHLRMSADEASLFHAYNAARGWSCLPRWQEAANLWYERKEERKRNEFD